MRTFLKPCERWIKPAWVLPLALVALPNCVFTHGQGGPPFTPSITPGTTLVLCDLRMLDPEPQCSRDLDIDHGVSLMAAAIALVQGWAETNIGVDYSSATQARCGDIPEGIVFAGPFPYGTQVCVDPASVGPGLRFLSSTDVCVHKCLDLKSSYDWDAAALAFCQERAAASTNVPADPNVLFANGCGADGMPVPGFADPRREGEPVDWVNTVGVDTSGGKLTRNAPCAPAGCAFDAGAASLQNVVKGHGYLEFTVNEQTTNRIIGLTTGAGTGDHDLTFESIGFALDFFRDGCIYLYENGAARTPLTPVPSTGCILPANTFGHYAPGDRFRIQFSDAYDGTAIIDYWKLIGPCTPGSECPAGYFYLSRVRASYPLHVDASFFEQSAALYDIRLVYIH